MSGKHLTAQAVAECFEVEVRWVEEVCAIGLLGDDVVVEREITISVEKLDLVARIVRLHRQGVQLEGILWILGGRRD